MEKELEELIKKALSEKESTGKQEEKNKIPKVTEEEMNELYEKDEDYWKN